MLEPGGQGDPIHVCQEGAGPNAQWHRGGRVAYWLSRDIVFGLHLDTQEATLATLPRSGEGEVIDSRENTLLGMTPEGRLCAIQICWPLGLWKRQQKYTCIHLWWP
jgi:hypothetical protein